MGFYIQADVKKLKQIHEDIEQTIAVMDDQMSQADQCIQSLSGVWSGTDAGVFCTKWSALTGEGSSYAALRQTLQQYADFFAFSANRYGKVQLAAVLRAAKLKV